MRFGILTWFKAINHGALLQAYASQQTLKKLGVNPVFLDYEWKAGRKIFSGNALKNKFRKLVAGDLKYRKTYLAMKKAKGELFQRFINESIDSVGDCYNERYDNLMIGSDMVFNVREGWQPCMFGIGVQAEKRFSYAACSGGEASVEIARKRGYDVEIKKALQSFSGFGVRDSETENFLRAMGVAGRITPTIDPVLLYGYEGEKTDWDAGKWSGHNPYLLVYSYFSHMNGRKEVAEIKKYAKNNNLEIVSCGYYHPWCHENINADPKEFLEMFVHASSIVTDTFHGTVFSLINEKDFATILRGNSFKVRDLLCKCGLEDRIVNADQICGVLSRKVDYPHFNQWLNSERANSMRYLESQIGV